MKKLILLAGVFAIGGAFATCQYIPKTPSNSKDSAWAYKWKFTGKTTKAVKSNCTGQPITRSSASLKIQGWTLYCEPSCEDFEDTTKAQEVFWQTKPYKTGLVAEVTFEVANIIGKKGKNYEAAGQAVFMDNTGAKQLYSLTFAGFGKFDRKEQGTSRVKSVSGNFAGVAAAPSTDEKSDCKVGALSKVWTCCECPILDADSVAYGKWSVKYNKSISKKYANGKLQDKHILPKWAR